MGTISYTIPSAGSTFNSIADPEIATALQTILTWANGNIDAVNVSALLAQAAGVNQAGQIVKGATNIATSQATSSTTFTTLATPDQVTGIVLPTNGIIRVRFRATWQESVSAAANADIFINGAQLKGGLPGNTTPVTNAANIANSVINTNYALASYWGGLLSANAAASTSVGTGPYGGDVTTGQALGFGYSSGLQEFWAGGPCEIFGLSAGTYTVSVQFKASSGTVTVSNRKLWVEAVSFS